MKKITLQEIADACGVSRVTVWKAFNRKEGVNEALRGKILEKALAMGYPISQELMEQWNGCLPADSGKPFHVALVVSRPETSMFWGKIITSISEFFKKKNCTLSFICLPAMPEEEFVLPEPLCDGTVQGMIVMNIYEPKLFWQLNALPMPKVFLDAMTGIDFTDIDGDLILIEGRSTVEEIVESVILQGKQKIGFVGDIRYAQTNYERYLGYCSAMQNHGLRIPEEYCLTESFGLNSAQLLINRFLEELEELPEMLVCASDYIAHLVLQQLTLMGYETPRDILLSGFDDNLEFGHTSTLTSVHVQNTNMGVRLGQQLYYHLQYPDADNEFTYIRSEVKFRASTQVGGTL